MGIITTKLERWPHLLEMPGHYEVMFSDGDCQDFWARDENEANQLALFLCKDHFWFDESRCIEYDLYIYGDDEAAERYHDLSWQHALQFYWERSETRSQMFADEMNADLQRMLRGEFP
ncbi:MAG: hypothetical protein SA339_08390 [Methanomassiliicoccus sp.]|nr:hypothetical protein [Methanomassiliicoccus sp.]